MRIALAPLFKVGPTPEFVTDGCSGLMTWIWNKVFGRDPSWEGACEAHDLEYWVGENWRMGADWRLATAVMKCGSTGLERSACVALAVAMLLSVRVGGSRWLPFSWRWLYRLSWREAMLFSWWRSP